jgi:hypothetical protein
LVVATVVWSGHWRRRRAWSHLLAAEDAREVRRDVLDGNSGGGGRGGVDDANVGEDLPRQPPPVEVVHVRREAVGHGRSGARGRGKGAWFSFS